MEDKEELLSVELRSAKRSKNGDYINIYLYVDGCRFELVPHTRSVRETAYFYSLLKKSKLCAD